MTIELYPCHNHLSFPSTQFVSNDGRDWDPICWCERT